MQVQRGTINTTIKINELLKKRLDKIKVHPRQSYAEVLEKLLEETQ